MNHIIMSLDPSNDFSGYNIITADIHSGQNDKNRTHDIINQDPLNRLKRTVGVFPFCQLILDILQLYKRTNGRMIQNVLPLGVNMSY